MLIQLDNHESAIYRKTLEVLLTPTGTLDGVDYQDDELTEDELRSINNLVAAGIFQKAWPVYGGFRLYLGETYLCVDL